MAEPHLLRLTDLGTDIAAAIIIRLDPDGGLRVEQEWDHGIDPLLLARILHDTAERIALTTKN